MSTRERTPWESIAELSITAAAMNWTVVIVMLAPMARWIAILGSFSMLHRSFPIP
ncbi:hypothetical protein [Sorangium sp. So ce1000]|uniref:hypothetical protein n=1 Tax=Sorangium sp. So ce1000 TaxID=3133325 RepID=UPI003F5F64FB